MQVCIISYIIHRSKKTVAVLAKHADRPEVMALPTYSLRLNLIERLRKYLRCKVTHNHLFNCIADRVAAVTQFLTDLDGRRSEVLSVRTTSQEFTPSLVIPNDSRGVI